MRMVMMSVILPGQTELLTCDLIEWVAKDFSINPLPCQFLHNRDKSNSFIFQMFHSPEKIIMNNIDKNTLKIVVEKVFKNKKLQIPLVQMLISFKKLQFHLFVQANFKQKSQLQIVPMLKCDKITIFGRSYHQQQIAKLYLFSIADRSAIFICSLDV